MPPQEARIALFENFMASSLMVRRAVETIGSLIVALAHTPETAHVVIDNLGKIGANVALVHSRLSEDGYEGYGVVRRIQTEHPAVHVLSIFSNALMGEMLRVPTVLGYGMGAPKLRAAIELL
jgi:hypothetical protein